MKVFSRWVWSVLLILVGVMALFLAKPIFHLTRTALADKGSPDALPKAVESKCILRIGIKRMLAEYPGKK